MSLDQRTRAAHQCQGAQALISIHANSASKNTVSGIETFCHKPGLFTSFFKHSRDMLNSKIDSIDNHIDQKSNKLAQFIHSNLLKFAHTQKPDIVDRKVKHKVSQLLLGAEVPSILLEVGFLTNKREADFLQKKSYQKTLAKGILKGLDEFFNVM